MDRVTEQVVILVLMMAVGFVAAKTGIVTGEGRSMLTRLVLYVTQPFLVINSFQMDFDPTLLRDMGVVAVFAALSMGACYLLGMAAWPRGDDAKRRVLWQATVFSNCGFMGLPVLSSLFGNEGVIYVSVFVIVFTVYTWTLGIYIYAGKSGGWKDILLQPGLIAVAVVFFLFLTGLRLPSWANRTAEGLGSLTTPLAMIIVGALVAEGDFRHAFRDWTVFAAAAMRLFVLPALALGAFWLFTRILPGAPEIIAPHVASACVLLTGMPVAANVAIFASMYSVKPQYAAHTVLVSTLLSVAAVPLWIIILQAVKLIMISASGA